MYLDQIVDYINSTVKLRMGAKAAHSEFYGICKIVEKDLDGEKAVILYDNAGNDINVEDDSFHLFCYHRFLGFTFQPNEVNAKDSYGDGSSLKSANANFVMGVYGNRRMLDLTDQELTSSICFNFPDDMPGQLTGQLTGIGKIIISPVSTNNQNTQEPLKPSAENIFFTINYKALIVGDVSCLTQCNPVCL